MLLINETKLNDLDACPESLKVFREVIDTDIDAIDLILMAIDADSVLHGDCVKAFKPHVETTPYAWAGWLITRLLSNRDRVCYAIFAAEQVIDIWQKLFPSITGPQKAIESARDYLRDPESKITVETKRDTLLAAEFARGSGADSAADACGSAYFALRAAESAYSAAHRRATPAVINYYYEYAAEFAWEAVVYATDAKRVEWRMTYESIINYGIELLRQNGGAVGGTQEQEENAPGKAFEAQ